MNSTEIPLEKQEHKALMKWIYTQPLIRDVTIHIPNEGKREERYGKFLVNMGMKAGVSDLFIALPNKKYHGLWIELKRRKFYRCSDEQIQFQQLMKKHGYAAHFAYGWEEGKEIIENYMKDYVEQNDGSKQVL